MNKGKIVQVIGPVVDVRFEAGHLPSLYNAIKITNPSISDREGNLTVEVAQHLGDNVVRCVAMDSTDGLVRGMDAIDTGGSITIPVGREGGREGAAGVGRLHPADEAVGRVHRDGADDVVAQVQGHFNG